MFALFITSLRHISGYVWIVFVNLTLSFFVRILDSIDYVVTATGLNFLLLSVETAWKQRSFFHRLIKIVVSVVNETQGFENSRQSFKIKLNSVGNFLSTFLLTDEIAENNPINYAHFLRPWHSSSSSSCTSFPRLNLKLSIKFMFDIESSQLINYSYEIFCIVESLKRPHGEAEFN